MKKIYRVLSVIFVVCILISSFSACSETKAEEITTADRVEMTSIQELGEGETEFIFQVHDENGKITPYKIRTDKKFVGEALQELGLIKGEEGDFGLYVKEVNGILADYSVTGTYWAFYVENEYASKGIDMTEAESGKTYSLRIEK